MQLINADSPAFKHLSPAEATRTQLLLGSAAICEPVASTMGPRGLNVLIAQPYNQPPIATNDGKTVADSIDLEDPIQNMAAQLIKQAASATNQTAGDGTSATTVLANALLRSGLKAIAIGANPVLFKRELDVLTANVVAALKTQSQPVKSSADIKHVAQISSQNAQVAEVLADLYDKLGPTGVIDLAESNLVGITGEFTSGFSWNAAPWSPSFLANASNVELVDVPVLLLDLPTVAATDALVPLMTALAEAGTPRLVVVARNFGTAAIATQLLNNVQGSFNSLVVQPDFRAGSSFFEDLSALTGAPIINETCGVPLKALTPAHLGHAAKASVTMTQIIIQGPATSPVSLASHLENLSTQVTEAASPAESDRLLARIARLTTGIGVLTVGALTPVETRELKLRAEDAINATRAASLEGIVAGGGTALAHIAQSLRTAPPDAQASLEARLAHEAMTEVLETPLSTIAINANQTPAIIKAGLKSADAAWGFNALTLKFENLVKSGVIDPTLVVRSALENAVSAVGTLLTTAHSISPSVEKLDPTKP